MQKKQLMMRKPAYRNGQLLVEEDFVDEQQYHSHARYLHARYLHGFGAAHGLDVSRAGDLAVTVSPGYAVDRKGREIELREPETLEVHGLPVGALAWVTIGYRSERQTREGDGDNRIDCYAYLKIATGVEPFDVRLCSVQLDERGRLAHDAIGHLERDQLRSVIAPGSVTAESLHADLRKDWIAMTFHPTPIPQDETDSKPPFRVGATQAQAHREYDGKDNQRGAAGTMGIRLPPGVRHIHRFRIAGSANDKKMTVSLVKGGFDPQTMKHLRDEIVSLQIGEGPYYKTADIPEAHRSMKDRHRTLAVDVRADGFAKVSLLALEVSY